MMEMSRIRQFKKRADSVLEEVFRTLFEEIDTEKIRREISALQSRAPDFEPIDHARLLVRRTAIRCAAAGAVTGLPSGLLAIGTLGADLAFLMFQQFRLIIGIATIYGHEPSHRQRFTEALACLAYASGVGLGKQGIATVLESAKEANTHWTFDKYDTYEWYLDLGPLSNANAKYFHGRIPTWNDLVYRGLWKDALAVAKKHGLIKSFKR